MKINNEHLEPGNILFSKNTVGKNTATENIFASSFSNPSQIIYSLGKALAFYQNIFCFIFPSV